MAKSDSNLSANSVKLFLNEPLDPECPDFMPAPGTLSKLAGKLCAGLLCCFCRYILSNPPLPSVVKRVMGGFYQRLSGPRLQLIPNRYQRPPLLGILYLSQPLLLYKALVFRANNHFGRGLKSSDYDRSKYIYQGIIDTTLLLKGFLLWIVHHRRINCVFSRNPLGDNQLSSLDLFNPQAFDG